MREKYSNGDYYCPAFFDNVCWRNFSTKLTEIFYNKIFPFFCLFFFFFLSFSFFKSKNLLFTAPFHNQFGHSLKQVSNLSCLTFQDRQTSSQFHSSRIQSQLEEDLHRVHCSGLDLYSHKHQPGPSKRAERGKGATQESAILNRAQKL